MKMFLTATVFKVYLYGPLYLYDPLLLHESIYLHGVFPLLCGPYTPT